MTVLKFRLEMAFSSDWVLADQSIWPYHIRTYQGHIDPDNYPPSGAGDTGGESHVIPAHIVPGYGTLDATVYCAERDPIILWQRGSELSPSGDDIDPGKRYGVNIDVMFNLEEWQAQITNPLWLASSISRFGIEWAERGGAFYYETEKPSLFRYKEINTAGRTIVDEPSYNSSGVPVFQNAFKFLGELM